MDIQEKDRHDIILANPPFGGGERREVQQNFPIRTSETAYLFLQHFIRKLKAGGRGAVVIKNTFLSNTDNASSPCGKELLEAPAIAHGPGLPAGHVSGRGREDRCAVLREGRADARYLVLPARPRPEPRQDQPAERRDLAEFVSCRRTRRNGPKSWIVSTDDLDEETFDLSVKNPNAPEAAPLRSPEEIIADMLARDAETARDS
jgi:type I restriction enzyme M protein